MPISTGTRLGSYELLAQIGAGGMGEVYKAHDTKLGRDVAIKVLPEAFAHDPERLSRFQREAKMLAALNHTNIATIHGLEQSNGTSYLVMELVSGETLRERIAREGPVPLEGALKIAVQIAEALEAAHEKGIIHRDLKPANVKLTPEGKIKVLDFGLAKALAGEAANDDPSNSPTLSLAATMHGVILGTAAYMSPEQARGKAVDKRTDIWAFGCVLYELLTRKQAFQGEDVTDILAAVVRAEPDWQALPAATPMQVRDLLRRCLQKDKALRLRDAGDIGIELQEVLAAPAAQVGVAVPTPTLSMWRRPALVGPAGLLIGILVAGLVVWNFKPVPPAAAPVTRSVFPLPEGDRLKGDEPALALSPDGTHMAYVANRGGTGQLYVRSMDSFESRPLSGADGAIAPFFSPDSQWIGFFAESKLKKISLNGGAAVTISAASMGGPGIGATWGSNGNIIFQTLISGGLWQVPSAGGTPERLATLGRGKINNRWPSFVPGSKAVLFTSSPSASWASPQLELYRLDTGKLQTLISGTRPYYTPIGQLVFAQGGTLMAVPFDLQRLEIKGTPVPVVEGIMQSLETGLAQYSISDNGSLAYVPGGIQGGQSTLTWVDRKGVEKALPIPSHSYRVPRISPDGKRVAVVLDELGGNVWTYDLARDTLTRLTFEGGGTNTVAWTKDAKRVVFNAGGPANLFWQPADGSGKAERLTRSENQQNPFSFSADGQTLAYSELDPATSWDIWLLRLSDPSASSGQGRKAEPFLRTSSYETVPVFSPDGRWLAYVSDETGRFEIYVRPYPGPGGKWQVSTDGGAEPVWNPNGRELFYRNGPEMMAVDVTSQPGFSAGKPRVLFTGPYLSITATTPSYDVSPDGQRFLMMKPDEQQPSSNQINIVQNWFEELKRRVPSGTK